MSEENKNLESDLKVTDEPGDVLIEQPIPTEDQLNDIKSLLSTASPDQLNQLLANLSHHNNMNPDNKYYRGLTKEEMVKMKFKEKMRKLKSDRSSKQSVKYTQEKLKQKMMEQMKQVSDKNEKDKLDDVITSNKKTGNETTGDM